MRQVVPVTDYTFPTLEPEQKVLARVGATVIGHQAKTEAELISAVAGHSVVITQFAPMTRKVLETLAPGSSVIRYGVGVDNIDLKAAKELGIKVAYVPDYCMAEVADHTVSMMLSLLRRLPMLDAGVRAGRWDGIQLAKPMLPLNQTVIGLIGLGRIGREVVKRLKVFGCQFLVFDPYLKAEQAEDIGVGPSDLETVLKQADALSLHIPLSAETRHFINKDRLAQMKPTAILVNTARGGLVDAEALANALHRKTLYAAALDVFEIEPLPADSPLRNAPNLLLSPHLAWYSETAIERLQYLAAEEALRALKGEALRCPYPL
ncbi:MAG: C-terminal binding protein [Trueperaceae bacterium]|nr:C-terminal binding protein [Trueperaceae bacterium]